MLWNSNFFMTPETMKILRVLIDVWLPDFKFGPGRCAMSLAKTPWYWETVTGNIALIGVGRRLLHPASSDAEPRRVLYLSGPRMGGRAYARCADERDGAVSSRQFLRSTQCKVSREYAEIARRPNVLELNDSWHRARELAELPGHDVRTP